MPEESRELKSWIESSPENKKEFLAIKDIWDLSLSRPDNSNDHLALFYKNQLEKSKKSRLLWIRYSTAAAALLAVGLIISILIPKFETPVAGNEQVFSVPLGSKSKILLADGTEVNLNSGSELRYPANFSSSNRIVQLTGEGFFKVKSDQEHPFRVNTTDFDVKVTGTQFNVCTYAENKFATATLTEGNIHLEMKGSGQTFEIKPGEKFELDRSNRKYILEEADIESEVAWKDGQFIFRNIPFPELVQRLERWYDVKLDYSGTELQNFKFTGRFKNQETIWQVLDALKLTSPIDYRKTTFREFTLIYKPLK
jgi:ferric-dicitrate binding protein FerR (iron transport regulator)